jgi:hypothetical protein
LGRPQGEVNFAIWQDSNVELVNKKNELGEIPKQLVFNEKILQGGQKSWKKKEKGIL